MATEPIGELTTACPFGLSRKVFVKKSRNKRESLFIWSPELGPVFLNTHAGQDWILRNARMYGPEGPPDEHEPEPAGEGAATGERQEPDPDPEPEPKPEPEPEPEPPSDDGTAAGDDEYTWMI